MLLEEKKKISEFSILPYVQNWKLRNLGKCSFTLNFDSSCNLRFRNNKNDLRQKLKGQDMLLEEKKKISEMSEFSILPYTQNWKLRNLGKCSFTSNFDSSYNLRFRNDKNELSQKLKVIKWTKKKKRNFLRSLSFQFCSIPKIENSEISESVPLLQILTVFVTFSEFAFSANRVKPSFFLNLILSHIIPENFIKAPLIVWKIFRFSRSILIFSSSFGVFWLLLGCLGCCYQVGSTTSLLLQRN